MIRFRTDSCASSSVFISVLIKMVICPCPRRCPQGYDIVPFHFAPFQKVVQRGVAFTWVWKKIKQSIPKQVRKLGDTKKWPRNQKDTISYHSVLVRTEAVSYHTAFRTCLVSMGDTKLTSSDVEVEIRHNCTSLILPIVWSFENRPLTSTIYPLINVKIHVNV